MFKPILFNSEMVKAILDGRKTQTRRLVKPQPVFNEGEYGVPVRCDDDSFVFQIMPYECIYEQGRIPPCVSGDILWVRETWSTTDKCGLYPAWPSTGTHYMYRGDSPDHELAKEARWFPSIHMPKEAARLFLRVKNVRVERLQDITVLNAINEGCCGTICNHANSDPALGCTDCYNTGWLEPPDAEFALLWDTTVKKADLPVYGWDANPWVWVIEFERCEKPEGWCEK